MHAVVLRGVGQNQVPLIIAVIINIIIIIFLNTVGVSGNAVNITVAVPVDITVASTVADITAVVTVGIVAAVTGCATRPSCLEEFLILGTGEENERKEGRKHEKGKGGQGGG